MFKLGALLLSGMALGLKLGARRVGGGAQTEFSGVAWPATEGDATRSPSGVRCLAWRLTVQQLPTPGRAWPVSSEFAGSVDLRIDLQPSVLIQGAEVRRGTLRFEEAAVTLSTELRRFLLDRGVDGAVGLVLSEQRLVEGTRVHASGRVRRRPGPPRGYRGELRGPDLVLLEAPLTISTS